MRFNKTRDMSRDHFSKKTPVFEELVTVLA